MSDQRDPDEGLPICEALERLAPPDLWRRYKEIAAEEVSVFIPGPGYHVSDEALSLRCQIERFLVARLRSGDIIANGIFLPLHPGSERQDVTQLLWLRLELDLRKCEACGDGVRVVELLLRSAHAATTHVSRVVRSSRRPGRPSIMPEICAELRRRAAAGHLETSLRLESDALVEWATAQFPDDIVPQSRSVQKKLGRVYRELRNEKSADKTSDKP